MALLNLKIRAATIVESLVAITIISMVFGSTLFLFINVGRDMNQPLKTIASVLVSNEITKLAKTKNFSAESYSRGNIIIDKQLDKNDTFEDLDIITITARRKDNGRIILQRRLLIPEEQLTETFQSNED